MSQWWLLVFVAFVGFVVGCIVGMVVAAYEAHRAR